uniref:Uncharacterized protein n=1 Tax=Lygus hesperus TaxID=30085 RepID=A0A146LZX3_LYGHE
MSQKQLCTVSMPSLQSWYFMQLQAPLNPFVLPRSLYTTFPVLSLPSQEKVAGVGAGSAAKTATARANKAMDIANFMMSSSMSNCQLSSQTFRGSYILHTAQKVLIKNTHPLYFIFLWY